jgi:hypothetical protein
MTPMGRTTASTRCDSATCSVTALHFIQRQNSLNWAYNGQVDRANAIRLLKALVAAGANPDTLMAGTWVCRIALEVSLQGTNLASALAYAEAQGWIADGVKKGWMTVTRLGERAARLYVV